MQQRKKITKQCNSYLESIPVNNENVISPHQIK